MKLILRKLAEHDVRNEIPRFVTSEGIRHYPEHLIETAVDYYVKGEPAVASLSKAMMLSDEIGK